jgi:hypothetical protein
MPPGLYEIVITGKSESDVGAELLAGDFNVRIEERSLEDIRALGGNSIEDEREFETVARLSELNNAWYSTFVQPWLKTFATPQTASAVLAMQPLRLQYAMFSDKNPLMPMVAPLADKARAERKTPDTDNPFLRMQEQVSEMVTASLEAFGQLRDQTQEAMFHAIYGSPWLQALLGVRPSDGPPRPKPDTSPEQSAALAAKIEEGLTTMDQGGPLEAQVRSLVYIAMGQGSVDARSFEVLRRVLVAHPDMPLARYKAIVREQWARLTIDQGAALKALPRLLPAGAEARRDLFEEVRAIRTAAGELDGEAKRRLDEIEALFDIGARAPAAESRHIEEQVS